MDETSDRLAVSDARHRPLGADGPVVNAAGFGAMSFGGFYGEADDEQSLVTLETALELGVDHWDVANVYGDGRCEQIIGRFFETFPEARGKITLATKGGIEREPERHFDNKPDHIRACLEASLERLKTDHVELYYLHRRDPDIAVEKAIEGLVPLIEEGLIGGIGLSEIAPSTLERASAVHPIRAVQSEYSLWTRLPELGMIEACKRHGTAFVAFSSVGRGIFGDVPLNPERFHDGDFRKNGPRFSPENFPANEEKIRPFRALARVMGVASATLANAWVLNRADHIHVIPGTRTPEHLAQNAAASGLELSDEQMAAIEAILPAGFAHGARYTANQRVGTEDYC